eukprot:Pompholyxophrys_punicea_v1_NODE_489_length_1855_cov_3.903333.p1 type:complete len:111 gc:universal NODE_489_length_1855_cov_3.903333:272-604(+)
MRNDAIGDKQHVGDSTKDKVLCAFCKFPNKNLEINSGQKLPCHSPARRIAESRLKSSSLKPGHEAAVFGSERNLRLVLPSFEDPKPCFTTLTIMPIFSCNFFLEFQVLFL